MTIQNNIHFVCTLVTRESRLRRSRPGAKEGGAEKVLSLNKNGPASSITLKLKKVTDYTSSLYKI